MHLLFVFFMMSNCRCFIAAMFAKVLDSFMHWLLVFFKTSLSSCYIAAMFARFFLHLHELPSGVLQVIHLQLLHMCNMYKEIGLLHALISYHSCFIAAMFENILDSFMYWLLVSFKLSILIHFIAAMFARVNDSRMNFCKWSICSSFISSICTRNFDIFTSCNDFWCSSRFPFVVASK